MLDAFDARTKKNPVLMFLATFMLIILVLIFYSILEPLLSNFLRGLVFFLFVGPAFFGAFFLFARVLRFFEGKW